MSLAKEYLAKALLGSAWVEQTDPPRSPRETLPTMYDLPSEDPEEPGLPDEYHYLQPQLLSATFRLPDFPLDQAFTAGDMNLYYDVHHPLWYKRPDWFAVKGISRLYDKTDLRLSYVIWQEGISPSVIVELLSPGTEGEDLGQTKGDRPTPSKWQVYEQILRVPYYVLFDRYTDRLRAFKLVANTYEAIELNQSRIWIDKLNLGLGLWHGEYQGITRQWLRWFDALGNWISTETEQIQQERQNTEQARQNAEQERQNAEQERQNAEQERQRANRLADRLRELGIDPDS